MARMKAFGIAAILLLAVNTAAVVGNVVLLRKLDERVDSISVSTRSISQNAERLASDVSPRSWEYHVEFLADSTGLAVLQQRGLEGWQVVNFRRAQNAEVWGSEVLFRRPKP